MAAFGIDGLASGLDTTSLINQLMRVEAMPQTLLKSKQTTTQTFVSGLQALNTRVASLAEAATKAAKAESWNAYRATSTSEAATATTSGTAQPGTLSFSVDAVATTQVTLSAKATAGSSILDTVPPAVTIKKHDGTFVTVQPTTGSLSDVAKAINAAADSGVRATVVRVSNGVNGGEPEYRLQLTGTTTGTEGSFEVYDGDADQVQAYTPAELAANRIDSNVVRAAEDAVVTLWKGVAGLEETVTQSSNTFSNLMTGVDVTVSAVTGPTDPPVTLTVERDDEALAKLASGMIGSLGVVLSEISSKTATTTSTGADGRTTVTGGIFTGDSTVRSITSQLSTAISMPVDGRSPSEVGIIVGRDGTFTFDEEKFAAALAADPVGTQAMVSQIAERVATAASAFSDKYDGTLTKKIESQQGQVRAMGDQIESWDRRLELRRAGLQRQYAALEVSLSGLQSQSSWLAGQLASLPTYSRS